VDEERKPPKPVPVRVTMKDIISPMVSPS